MSRYVAPVSAGLLALVASVPVFAQTVTGLDVTAATAYLSGDVTDAIIAVGGALILLAALAMGFKWIKAMFFG
jgi:hypothetical protein